jgi:hypothetical protein
MGHMPKIISHFEMGRTLTWVVVNDDGTVTMRIETSRSSKMKTVSAAEAMHRWPTLVQKIEAAVREICGEPAPAPLMARSSQR